MEVIFKNMLEEEVEISRRYLGLVSVRVWKWGKIGQAENVLSR